MGGRAGRTTKVRAFRSVPAEARAGTGFRGHSPGASPARARPYSGSWQSGAFALGGCLSRRTWSGCHASMPWTNTPCGSATSVGCRIADAVRNADVRVHHPGQCPEGLDSCQRARESHPRGGGRRDRGQVGVDQGTSEAQVVPSARANRAPHQPRDRGDAATRRLSSVIAARQERARLNCEWVSGARVACGAAALVGGADESAERHRAGGRQS